MRLSRLLFLLAILLGLAAWVGAMSDEDFFNPADFFDTTSLHHEHLVLLAAGAAFFSLLMSGLAFLRELRVLDVPGPSRDSRERV